MTDKLTPTQLAALRHIGENGSSSCIHAATLNSLERRGLIELEDDWYYTVTDAGVEVIVESERKESR